MPSRKIYYDNCYAVSESGCWEWLFAKNELGYGTVWFSVKKMKGKAHRWMYEYHVGEIPEGLELDHLCRNPGCVNPEHLEPVTHLENVRRGGAPETVGKYQLRKTHCPHGHSYSGDNLYTNSGRRHCRTCKRRHKLEYRMRKKNK